MLTCLDTEQLWGGRAGTHAAGSAGGILDGIRIIDTSTGIVVGALVARRSQVGPEGGRYCTVYEIESDDPNSTFQDLLGAAQSGKLTMSDASTGRAKMTTMWVERTPRTASS